MPEHGELTPTTAYQTELKILGERIRAMRYAIGLTIDGLASQSTATKDEIRSMEAADHAARSIRADVYASVCKALNLPFGMEMLLAADDAQREHPQANLPGDDRTAFPFGEQTAEVDSGLTARDYACIELRVPQAGKPWLNELITEARRLDALDVCEPNKTAYAPKPKCGVFRLGGLDYDKKDQAACFLTLGHTGDHVGATNVGIGAIWPALEMDETAPPEADALAPEPNADEWANKFPHTIGYDYRATDKNGRVDDHRLQPRPVSAIWLSAAYRKIGEIAPRADWSEHYYKREGETWRRVEVRK